MKLKVLKTEKDHREALRQVEALWNAPRGSSQAAELELWATLIDAYEREHHLLPSPDPVEAIRFRVERMGHKPGELAKIMGGGAAFPRSSTGGGPFRFP